MPEANIINEHMEVIGSDGVHIGTVDHVDGARIKLTKAGSDDGAHHYVATGTVTNIRGNTIGLSITAAEALASVPES